MPRSSDSKNVFSSVKSEKVPDIVYNQLVSLISRGHFKPGQRLPSEREMAFELEVSRQSLREAINRARLQGLLEVKQGGGTFVISSLKDNLLPPLSILLEKEAKNVLEFLEMRKVIEGWCAEKAALAAQEADLRSMEEILERMGQAKVSDAVWQKKDLEFHSSIAAATHNLIALHIMEGLEDSFQSYFRLKKYSTKPERKDVLLVQHRRIFEAISRNDPAAARVGMLEHLDYVEEIIEQDLLGED